ncbi:MAG: hypothetical protein ACXWL5_04535 [Candidatus Chromulinivorax sp.]
MKFLSPSILIFCIIFYNQTTHTMLSRAAISLSKNSQNLVATTLHNLTIQKNNSEKNSTSYTLKSSFVRHEEQDCEKIKKNLEIINKQRQAHRAKEEQKPKP